MIRCIGPGDHRPNAAADHRVEEHLLSEEHDDVRDSRGVDERDGRHHGATQVSRSVDSAKVVLVLLVW